jgi:predicted RNase H-like nuclease (RuvC/YqgF family)
MKILGLDLQTWATILAIIGSLYAFAKFGGNSLAKFVSNVVKPLTDGMKDLKGSIDRLNELTKAEFTSIHKELDLHNQEINLHEKKLAVQETQIEELQKDTDDLRHNK